jgi:phosphohistidine phosphatase
MKRLTILRHAKSSWDQPDGKDFDRPLNDRGWTAARRMGRELKRRHVTFDLVLASMAARVRETLDGLREEFEIKAPVRFEPEIYHASEAALLALVRALPDTVEAPLLVGHNPGLQELILGLTRDDPVGRRRRVAQKFPTAGLATIELPVEHWSEVGPGRGSLTELIIPRDLD